MILYRHLDTIGPTNRRINMLIAITPITKMFTFIIEGFMPYFIMLAVVWLILVRALPYQCIFILFGKCPS